MILHVLVTPQSDPAFMCYFSSAKRQRRELTAFWKTPVVQAGFRNTASEGVYITYAWDAGADSGRWWCERVQPDSVFEFCVSI